MRLRAVGILLCLAIVATGGGAEETGPPPKGFVLERERDVARLAPGPHAGAGQTTGYHFFDDVSGVPFAFRKRALHPGSSIGPHEQHEDEVYYVQSGAGQMTIDGETFDVGPGDAVLTRPGSTHALAQRGSEDLVILIVYPSAGTTSNATSLDADGTAHITRVVPVPSTVSPRARALLATGAAWAPPAGSAEQAALIEKARALYPVRVEDGELGGVPVKIVAPPTIAPGKRDRVLLNFHGGGFVSDSGSMLESIPIASLTGTKVVTALYRLAPEHPYPAAVDDAVAVYRELLRSYAPDRIAVYGTSAGAILSGQLVVRLKGEGVPLPAAVGFFTGLADFAHPGDSLSFFGVPGLEGARAPAHERSGDGPYLGRHDPADPLVSPIGSDLEGFPPTLCVTGTRDLLLSGTVAFHRSLLAAGVDARLVVFEAMPHAHWYQVEVPEAAEALRIMAEFLDSRTGS